MAASYRKSKGNFIFHNANPAGRLRTCDCVVRAISTATTMTWEQVYKDLFEIGLELKDLPNADCVYRKYLEETLGYKREKQPRKADNSKYTLTEFADKFNEGIYIVTLAGHLTTVINGKIHDTWDCGNWCVGNYWEVNDYFGWKAH